MQRLEVSGAVRHIYVYVIRRLKVNWLVFVTERNCVYCAVRTGYLYINQVNLIR
jgi:hypothetical protein